MTTPRIVTSGDDWQTRHEPIIDAWARRHLNEILSTSERQYTPEFLRAYAFAGGQENSNNKRLVYSNSTYSDLRRRTGLEIGDPTKDSYIGRVIAQTDPLRIDKVMAYQLWRDSNAQHMPPALGLVHYDAYVNHGATGARNMLAQSHGDANRYIDVRDQFYANIPENASEGGPKANPGWRERRIPALRREVQLLGRMR